MATIRTYIQDFATANALYVNAIVTFHKVLNGAKSAELATLYSSLTGEGLLKNPQKLDSFGKFRNPVYIDEAVIMAVTGLQNVEDHDTGVVQPEGGFDFWGIVVENVENKTFNLVINSPVGMVIHSITTLAGTGSCTVTGKINGTNLGGDPNAASTSEQEQEHEDDNVVAVGDTFSVQISGNASCENLSITIKYSRL